MQFFFVWDLGQSPKDMCLEKKFFTKQKEEKILSHPFSQADIHIQGTRHGEETTMSTSIPYKYSQQKDGSGNPLPHLNSHLIYGLSSVEKKWNSVASPTELRCQGHIA